MNKKIVIYKGTGGLIHMLCGLVYCIKWCKRNGYFLMIDVLGHPCFNHNLSDFFNIIGFKNHSEDYNMIDNNRKFHNIYIKDIKHKSVEVKQPNGTHHYMLERYNIRKGLEEYQPEDYMRIYAGPGGLGLLKILDFIKVNKNIVEMIQALNTMNQPYIGVHFRNTDRKNDIKKFIDSIKKYKNKNIYLATDDAKAYNIIIDALPNYNIVQYTKPFDANGLPIHYNEPNKYNLIFNILVDIYYLYKCEHFIPSNESLVSKFVITMRTHKKDIF